MIVQTKNWFVIITIPLKILFGLLLFLETSGHGYAWLATSYQCACQNSSNIDLNMVVNDAICATTAVFFFLMLLLLFPSLLSFSLMVLSMPSPVLLHHCYQQELSARTSNWHVPMSFWDWGNAQGSLWPVYCNALSKKEAFANLHIVLRPITAVKIELICGSHHFS